MPTNKILPRYSKDLFLTKLTPLTSDDEDLDVVSQWWRQIDETVAWMTEFERAIASMPVATAERADTRAAYKECKQAFDLICEKLAVLINMPDDNIVVRLWIKPALAMVRDDPNEGQFNEVVVLIRKFNEEHKTLRNDQMIAVSEAFSSHPNIDLHLARVLTAQWAFEEMFCLIPLQKIFEATEVGYDRSTLDELETERAELVVAFSSIGWKGEKKEKFRRVAKQIGKAMDVLNIATEVKRSFGRAIDYAMGDIGTSVSVIDILANIEYVWQGLKNDRDLQRVWMDEFE